MNVELNEVDGSPMFHLRVNRAIQTDMKYGIRIRYTQTAYQLDSTDGGFSDNLEGMLHLCMLLLDRPPWIHCIHRAMFGCTEVSIHM